MSNGYMDVEEFIDDVHPVGDRLDNIISTPNDEIPSDEFGDVNLVAVTGNEFMEVEDFLKHLNPVEESENNVIFTANDEIHASNSEDGELITSTSNELMEVDDFPKDVHSITNSQCEEGDAVVEKTSAQQGEETSVDECKGPPEGIVPFSATESNETHIDQSENGGECSKSVEEPIKSELSGPSGSTCTSSKPDFSKLKGKICLDSLSVRELQETFRATFGRETFVKDKQWLKRRISMALSNSCHVLSMTFLIDQGNTVKIVQDENARAIDDTLAKDLVVEERKENYDVDNQSEDRENVSGERLKKSSGGYDGCSEDQLTMGTGAKRARKPTRRYIEELSEIESRESGEKLLCVSKNLGHGHSVSKPRVRPECHTKSVRKPLVTRQDSLGGSGVRVPYVCRIRRSRPRENYLAFMNLQPGCMDVTTKHVKEEALRPCGPLDDCGENKVFSAGSDSSWLQKHIMDEPEKERQSQERETCEQERDAENVEPIQGDPSLENSDKDTPDMETAKGGVKRKHHRPWSLTEVVNLVEGVARFGVGRWSEIKRLSFASHSYRTSVDLKDKWRNLLRASIAQPAAEQGNSRKQVSAPIPPQILGRVRELSTMQAQVPLVLNSSKFSGENVHATSPGYL